MKFDDVVAVARDAMTARRVYGDPFTSDGTTVIPAVRVSGGAGGGGGHDPKGQEGEGGGFGLQARPVGAYVVKDGSVRWMPAVDVNRVIGVLGALGSVYLLTRAWGRRPRPSAPEPAG